MIECGVSGTAALSQSQIVVAVKVNPAEPETIVWAYPPGASI
jgi:hypothetical protein